MPHPPTALVLCSLAVALAGSSAAAQKPSLDTFEKQQLSKVFYAEGSAIGDFDGDGHTDVVVGPLWYRGPEFKEKRELYPPKPFDPKKYSDNFMTFTDDVDRDGRTDVVVVGWPGKEARWYRNPGREALDKHWPVHIIHDKVDNESPGYADADGDGRADLLCMSGGMIGYASPGKDATKPWTFHAVSPNKKYGRYTHGLGLGDVNGDGHTDMLDKTGWWERPAKWDGKTPWKHHPVAFGTGGAQMLVYDVDGDGDNDVVTSLHAHQYGLAWFEQQRNGDAISFKQHNIMTDKPEGNRFGVVFSQMHAMTLADMDGDGLLDVVTGKRWWAHSGRDPGGNDPAVLYWFRLTRKDGKVEFVPRRIDDDSGVGTQVTVGDVNGDKLPDVIVGNKRGAFVFTHRRAVSNAEPASKPKPAEANAGKTPQQTVAGMQLRDGFVASLVAGEPEVHQPIGFTIDHRGRLWVAENYSYPNWKPTGNDRIIILEDTNADGYHDKRTVFYDKLNFVSGIEVGFGGVYVGSPPNLLFIPDRDGDDKPDGEPRVLLDGWGHHDTHETLNAFTWGPDGWLYGCHGVFTHSRVGKPGTPDAEREPLNAGVWRYHPVREKFEIFAHGTSNPWGVTFDEHGECFVTACVIPHAFHIVPGGRYRRQAGRHFNPHTYDDIKTIADHRHYAGGNWAASRGGKGAHNDAGGGHAHAGALIYLGDQFPAEYRGKLLMNNIHGNRMNMDILKPRGSTFTASHGKDFMHAGDKWYRGLHIRLGPDGSVYVSDWYDPRACHQQKPHDRSNGRIYRISHGKPKHVAVDLSKKTNEELVDLQTHANEWHAATARRLLMERAASGIQMNSTWARLLDRIHNRDELTVPQRLRMQWTLDQVARNATKLVMPPRSPRRPKPTDPGDTPAELVWHIRSAADSPNKRELGQTILWRVGVDLKTPTVRRAAAAALQKIPIADRWRVASAMLGIREDAAGPMIPLLIWYGIEPLVEADPERALALIDKSKIPRVNEFIVRRAAALDTGIAALTKRLGATDSIDAMRMIVRQMRKSLESRARAKMPDGWEAVYTKLLATKDDSLADDARFIAVRFGDPRIFPMLRATVMNGKAILPQRKAAIETLVAGRDTGAADAFRYALDVPPLRLDALRGLALTEDAKTASAIVGHYAKLNADERKAAITTLAGRPSYAKAMMSAIGSGKIERDDLPLHAVRQMLAFKDEALVGLIEKHWGKLRAMSADKAAQMAKWKTLLNGNYMKTADPRNGRAVYARVCAACHTMHGEGGAIGPDLTGSNRTDLDYVLENVLDPNAVIGADYQLTVFTLKDGRVVSGMVRGENDTAVTVQMADQTTVVEKRHIEERQTLPISMMPEGLFASIQDSEVRDLIAYLREPRQIPLRGAAPVIEGESLRPTKITGGVAKAQDMTGFTADRWSGGEHLWWINAKPGDTLTLPIKADKPGRYKIVAAFTKARDYAIVQLHINGKATGEPIDLYQPKVGDQSDVISTGPVSLGVHKLRADSTLTVKIVGANPAAEKRYMFAIDYYRLTPAD